MSCSDKTPSGRLRFTARPFVAFALAALLAGCAYTSTRVGATPEDVPIVRIALSRSNVYLIKSRPPILVDSGAQGDMEDLTAALRENGVGIAELGFVLVTHGHADHAGLARAIRSQSSARIILGAGDVPLASGGHDDELIPMNLTARVLKPFISGDYPPFTADILVREGAPLDLKPAAGIDGQVLALPGHTPGSVVLVLANHAAFVGDLMMGGPLGGLFRPQDPQESYFHADRARNRRNIARLLALGVETLYLGHGGPVSRKDVAKAFDLALDGIQIP
jgi:hydroxyacylglutathione hydrolase